MNRTVATISRLSGAIAIAVAYAASASTSFPPIIDLATTTAPLSVVGPVGERIGKSVCGGDFDGNGVADLAVVWRRVAFDNMPPVISISWGVQQYAPLLDLATPPPQSCLITAGSGEFGVWTTIAPGDFNGDGIDDLAIGIANANGYEGKTHLVFGRRSFPGTIDLAANDDSISTFQGAPGSAGWLGYRVASGDVNNDGFDDLITSAWAYWPGGRVYVIYGRSTFPRTMRVDAPSIPITTIVDSYAYQGSGGALACGDLNQDGFEDLLIGSPGMAEGFFLGSATLLFGGPSLGSSIVLSDDMSGAIRIYGEYDEGQLGARVAMADINGDGKKDIVLTAPTADPGGCLDCGKLYTLYTTASMPDSIVLGTTPVAMTNYNGSVYGTFYGWELAVGDVDADGDDDIAVKREPGPTRREVVVIYGTPTTPGTVLLESDPCVTHIKAEQAGDDLGSGLAIFDLNADGAGDLVVGAQFANALGRNKPGVVRVFYGIQTATGAQPNRSPGIMSLSNYPNPFSRTTTIDVGSVVGGKLTIYDVGGRTVEEVELFRGEQKYMWAGRNSSGKQLPSGVYFCRFETDHGITTKKLLLIR